MELEDLKSIWKSSDPAFQPKNEQEIALMLKGKSVSIINKLKRNVLFELAVAIAASIGLIIYAFSLETGALKWTSISLLLMCLAYSIVYVKKLLLLNRFQALDGNLRDTISLLVESLTSYLKFYKSSYAILYPVYFMLGILFSILERGPDEYLEFLSKTSTLIYTVLVVCAFAAVFFFVSTMGANWYLKRLYGNHLEKLKSILKELHQ